MNLFYISLEAKSSQSGEKPQIDTQTMATFFSAAHTIEKDLDTVIQEQNKQLALIANNLTEALSKYMKVFEKCGSLKAQTEVPKNYLKHLKLKDTEHHKEVDRLLEKAKKTRKKTNSLYDTLKKLSKKVQSDGVMKKADERTKKAEAANGSTSGEASSEKTED